MYTYDKLWKAMGERDVTARELIEEEVVTPSELDLLRHNGNISIQVLDRLCNYLGVSIEEIVEVTF